MHYLKAAIALKSLIEEANQQTLAINSTSITQKNLMFLSEPDDNLATLPMESFTNEYVINTLKDNNQCTSFVITDLAAMDVKGKTLTYFLYKAYNTTVEKGLVYYQLIDAETMAPIGELLFSNAEENIFFKVNSPNFEESSCNAMETGEQTATSKKIVFLIGHMNEDRLAYDIERLIVDTVNNVQKNATVQFHFIIQVSVFGSEISRELLLKLDEYKNLCNNELYKHYSNAKFSFELEN